MPAYFDFFSTHIMANIQVLVGFHFYIKLLQKSARTYVYIRKRWSGALREMEVCWMRN